MRRNTEDDLAASKISWNNMNGQPVGQARDVDVDSNIQEGSQSEVGHVRVFLCMHASLTLTNYVCTA